MYAYWLGRRINFRQLHKNRKYRVTHFSSKNLSPVPIALWTKRSSRNWLDFWKNQVISWEILICVFYLGSDVGNIFSKSKSCVRNKHISWKPLVTKNHWIIFKSSSSKEKTIYDETPYQELMVENRYMLTFWWMVLEFSTFLSTILFLGMIKGSFLAQ